MGLQSTKADLPSIVGALSPRAASDTSAKRLGFVDNLRSSMVFLVVAFHTAITYSHIGSWYYNEPGQVDKTSAVFFFAFEAHCQAFFMGLLFLLAGYFVPAAYDRKGFGPFLGDRFIRLGVPSLIYLLLVQPMLQHFLLHYGAGLGTYYRSYILSGNVLSGSGPMWFALALLAFSAVYALGRTVRRPNENRPPRAIPGIGLLLVAGVALGVISFLVRLIQPLGTSIVNMQLCFFTQYIAMFIAGVVAFRSKWLELFPTRAGYLMLAGAVVLSPTVFLPLVICGGFLQNGLSPFLGGWHWQSAAYALWEQLAGVALCTGTLVLYRENISSDGPVSKLLARNSFGMYFLHPPVVVAVAQAFHWLKLAPLLKAVIMMPVCLLAVLGFVHLVARRVPVLKRIL
jgi:peptidoglycan/LPS O-acetylase OafA/YrhL